MRAIVIGFPKSGTSTIHEACLRSGLRSAHWRIKAGYCGELIYRRYLAGLDPLADFSEYDIVSQMDTCTKGLSYWPNLDFALLLKIRELHPQCRFILNTRPPSKTVSSIARWGKFKARLTRANIIGLPRGFGNDDSHLIQWIEHHYHACRRIFAADESFFELPIDSPDASDILAQAVAARIQWWGVANQTPSTGCEVVPVAAATAEQRAPRKAHRVKAREAQGKAAKITASTEARAARKARRIEKRRAALRAARNSTAAAER